MGHREHTKEATVAAASLGKCLNGNCLVPIIQPEQKINGNATTLLDCPERFSGEYNATRVQHFIDYIEAYRSIKHISEQQAHQELPHLLLGTAHLWWRCRSSELNNWRDAVTAIRRQFSQIQPNYLVYQQIFSKPLAVGEQQLTQFLIEKVLLLGQLPSSSGGEHLDMLYGLLPSAAQQALKRCDLTSVDHLLECVKQLDVAKAAPHTQHSIDADVMETSQADLIGVLNNNDASLSNGNKMAPKSREQLITVRRTEDLMPQPQITDRTAPALELSHAENNGAPIAQVETYRELMDQIYSIIDNCPNDETLPKLAKSAALPLQTAAVHAGKENEQYVTITHGLHEPAGVLADCDELIIAPLRDQAADQQMPKKMRSRWKICGSKRHAAPLDSQPKRKTSRSNELPQNRRRRAGKLPAPKVENAPAWLPSTTLLPPPPPSKPSETALLTMPRLAPITAESHTALATKVISPAAVPPSAVQLTATARVKASVAGNCNSSAKCHQCGTIGYYRSICPNCSPIYFYKSAK